jgi:hypothetical protein
MNSHSPTKLQVQPTSGKAEDLAPSNFAERWLRRKFPNIPPGAIRTYARLAGLGADRDAR